MADGKNNLKLTGDTHLPETESDDFDMQGSHPEGTGTEGTQASHRLVRGTRRGGRHAGLLRGSEKPSGDGETKESDGR